MRASIFKVTKIHRMKEREQVAFGRTVDDLKYLLPLIRCHYDGPQGGGGRLAWNQ